MSMSDPIADMLTRIRNGIGRKHSSVSMPASKTKKAIAEVLKEQGYIEGFEELENSPQNILRVDLKYVGDRRSQKNVITALERVSRPGRRVYVDKKSIPWVLNGMGIAVVTTSQGVMTGQQARRLGVGGELLCKVW